MFDLSKTYSYLFPNSTNPITGTLDVILSEAVRRNVPLIVTNLSGPHRPPVEEPEAPVQEPAPEPKVLDVFKWRDVIYDPANPDHKFDILDLTFIDTTIKKYNLKPQKKEELASGGLLAYMFSLSKLLYITLIHNDNIFKTAAFRERFKNVPKTVPIAAPIQTFVELFGLPATTTVPSAIKFAEALNKDDPACIVWQNAILAPEEGLKILFREYIREYFSERSSRQSYYNISGNIIAGHIADLISFAEAEQIKKLLDEHAKLFPDAPTVAAVNSSERKVGIAQNGPPNSAYVTLDPEYLAPGDGRPVYTQDIGRANVLIDYKQGTRIPVGVELLLEHPTDLIE